MIDELIKVIGSNSPIGRKLMKQIKDVCKNNHKEVDILELNHNQDKLEYNIHMIPAIVIDDKIISQGKTLSDKELKRLILSVSN